MRPSHAILCALLAAGLGAHAAAAAESWPSRPLTMVVPFAAGGGTDVMGRIVGRRLSEVLGQQVIIENVGGAGGMVGSARVAKAAPDGYTFVLGSRADAINQTLYKNPLYNLATDPSETKNLAQAKPEKLKELAATWQQHFDEFAVLATKDAPKEPAPKKKKAKEE